LGGWDFEDVVVDEIVWMFTLLLMDFVGCLVGLH
jgi:hypothetical protein